MRIKRVFVRKLFNLFDHDIDMKTDDRITIIHAPNGFGKTAILRMINSLFHGPQSDLRSIPFAVFGVEFEDGRTLKVETQDRKANAKESKPARRSRRNDPSVVVTFEGNSPFELPSRPDSRMLPFPLDAIDGIVPELTRMGPECWRAPNGDILDLYEVLSRYPHFQQYLPHEPGGEPPWLKEVRDAVDVQFIRADRLTARPQSNGTPTRERRAGPGPSVIRYSDELAAAIRTTLTRYAELSQSLDRSFPVRLVQHTSSEGLTNEEIKQRLSEFEVKRKKLMESGLLDQESDPTFQVPATIDDTKANVLSVYVRDVAQKLAVFDELAGKIDLLKSIVNRRFKHKRITVNRDKGILFTTDTHQPLDPTNLSSGEQHELVMLYELLFKVGEDSLILIDEPEISLHIAWQQEFLQDLLEMVRLSSFDVLIATHSPQIINEHWDLTVELQDTPELQEAVG